MKRKENSINKKKLMSETTYGQDEKLELYQSTGVTANDTWSSSSNGPLLPPSEPQGQSMSSIADEEQRQSLDSSVVVPLETRSTLKLSRKSAGSTMETRQRMQVSHRSNASSSVHSSKRTRLLVFVKIILKCLDSDDPSLHLEAKQIITECTRKNREGIPGYDSLADAITRQLRIAVGEVHWNRAESLMSHYLKTRTQPVKKLKIEETPKFTAV